MCRPRPAIRRSARWRKTPNLPHNGARSRPLPRHDVGRFVFNAPSSCLRRFSITKQQIAIVKLSIAALANARKPGFSAFVFSDVKTPTGNSAAYKQAAADDLCQMGLVAPQLLPLSLRLSGDAASSLLRCRRAAVQCTCLTRRSLLMTRASDRQVQALHALCSTSLTAAG